MYLSYESRGSATNLCLFSIQSLMSIRAWGALSFVTTIDKSYNCCRFFTHLKVQGCPSSKSIGFSSKQIDYKDLLVTMASQGLHGAATSDRSAKSPLSIDVDGEIVPVDGAPGLSETDVRKAVASSPFQGWLKNTKGSFGILSKQQSGQSLCSLRRILIQSVDMFGNRVGFVKFKAEVVDRETGAKLPGIVFARGGAVGILMLLECDGEKYAILTEQARVPVGRTLLELPAGMLDDDAGDFVGTAAREVEEETGIHINSSDLIDLTSLLKESTGRKMHPSPGGCDEDITLLLYRGTVKQEVVESLEGQRTGLVDHGELIKVRVVPYPELWRATSDAKALAAIALYEMSKKEGILPPPPNAPELSDL
ncbi:hypothetical protein O6H91_03G094700 [Diphasiastrum complanatum]|uniref:Uncharacterized protein n=1 Tax=Diphasiastrum complanatum TaxID=34168 RepID=A0ACC2E9J3_DIPCM|nr:hypothetical protein O6H91_03G094700 [Diphasiastrum complanatum]